MTDLNAFYLFNKIINELNSNEEIITNVIKQLSPKNRSNAYDAMEKKKKFTKEIRQRIQENVKTILKKEKEIKKEQKKLKDIRKAQEKERLKQEKERIERLKQEKERIEKLKYRFKICVREGAPGFADDDDYVSTEYNTFEDVYTALFEFNMNKHWTNLRMVQRMRIILNDNIEIYVQPSNYGIMIDDFKTLAITEEEFDKIIDKLRL